MDLELFATVPAGMESLLAGELRGLGGAKVHQTRAGVSFAGSLATAYRICLWSRLASRILMPLGRGPARDGDELYALAQRIDWDIHLAHTGTLAVDFTGTNAAIRDTRFGAVRVKDAIVDQMRARHDGARPSVDVREPDARINVHLVKERATISLDLSGESLHRRGYRTERVQVEAPLKENLAAAVLLFAEWPRIAAAGGSFADPLCGSGTLPIEAALMAADVAPGLLRAEAGRFGFLRWRGQDEAAWAALLAEARERRDAGLSRLRAAGPGLIRGADRDPRAVSVALECVRRAGLQDVVLVERRELERAAASPPAPGAAAAAPGLLAANPPYGERMGRPEEARAVFELLGARLRDGFPGWPAAVLAADRRLIDATGATIKRATGLRNGALPVTLALLEPAVAGAAAQPRSGAAAAPHTAAAEPRAAAAAPRAAAAGGYEPVPPGPRTSSAPRRAGFLGGGAEQLANRLRKNQRRLARWRRREGITCYRLYDADLPDYNLVVDVYGDWVHVQEYAAPPEIDPEKAQRRLDDALDLIAAELEAPRERMALKQRRRMRGAEQYERREAGGGLIEVEEDELKYLVDLTGYLDTGLFIDQRLTRRLVRRLSGGRRFLNLFGYTGTMTVNALAGGAASSTTVDLSGSYLDWARRNLAANGFAVDPPSEPAAPGPGAAPGSRAAPTGAAHRLVRADVLRWLSGEEGQYDVIWLDPPTFSNSKKMGRATFDVQRDHADLLRMAARRLLAPDGVILFATNRRGFKLHHEDLGGLAVKDLSRATLALDCARGASRHHVFEIRSSHAGSSAKTGIRLP